MKCKKALFAFMFILMLTGNLNAQETSPETTDVSESVTAEIVDDVGEALDSALDSEDSAMEDESEMDETDVDESDEDEDEDYEGEDESGEDESDEDESDEDESDEDEDHDDESDEYENAPVSIRVNENGEFVGQTQAFVSGNWLPVEANVALVSNGVLLNKIVADADGSFSFQDISPGEYTVYGTASSYCGQRSVTVLPERGCCDNVGVGLTQDSGGTCYSNLTSAPAATVSEATGFSGGFSSAPIAGGGGFATGGGALGGGAGGGFSGLRALAVGGIVTAIAVGSSDDDDDVSPSN